MGDAHHDDHAERDSDDANVAALTDTLVRTASGELRPSAELFAALYRELHRLARALLHGQGGQMTLGATTLLHEAYFRLSQRDARFPDRARFFAYAARAMRGMIVDHVRERRALKRGGEFHFTQLDTVMADEIPDSADDLSRLDEALKTLEAADPALAELVDLKFFAGFSFGEIATMRQVSERTVQRDWAKARLYLHDALRDES